MTVDSFLLLFNHTVLSNSLRPHDCSRPGLPVLHRLLKFAQVHVLCISMPSSCFILWHPLLLSSSFQASENEPAFCIRWPKYWSFSYSIMNIQGWFPLRLTGLLSLLSKGLWRVFSSTIVWRHQFFGVSFLYGPALTTVHDHWEDHSLNYTDLCRQSNVSAFQHTV